VVQALVVNFFCWLNVLEQLDHVWFQQWRIWGMAGMACAMGATLMGGAKTAWQKLKSLFTVSLTSILCPMHSETAKLHQHQRRVLIKH